VTGTHISYTWRLILANSPPQEQPVPLAYGINAAGTAPPINTDRIGVQTAHAAAVPSKETPSS